jgi:hypothetical protein
MKKQLLLLSFPAIIFAGVLKIDNSNSELSLTVYNNGYGMISENRTSNIFEGYNKIMYEGIPSSIVIDSVVPTFSKDVKIYSQNYGYDTFSLNSLIQKTIGKEVSYKDETIWESGTLLANNPILIKTINGSIITIDKPNQLKFTSIPEDMAVRPSLFWNINSKESGPIDINLKYLTNGLSWTSNYVLNLTDSVLSLQGWMSINNQSGISYNNANITCLAGDVNKVIDNHPIQMLRGAKMTSMEDSMEVKEESFSGYHIYKIPFKETIKDKEIKQVSFIQKNGIKYKTYGTSRINDNLYRFPKQEILFDNIIEFKNVEQNNLGIPIPSGIVRLYKEDVSKESRFIGEQRISNISDNEVVKINIGKLFDIKGTEEIIEHTENKNQLHIKTLISIENNGKEDKTVILYKNIPINGKVSDTCLNNCKKIKSTGSYEEFSINIKANNTYKFESVVNVDKF